MIKLVNKYKIILIIIVIVLINVLLLYKNQQKEEAVLLIEDKALTQVEEREVPVFATAEVPVYICGEVKVPGVYYVRDTAIVQEVVAYAGGFLVDANQEAVNLARLIIPHEKIIIPKIGEEIDKSDDSYDNKVSSARININTADLTQLKTLPGIGEAKANEIILYRETQGGFKKAEELKNVSGIGEKTYLKIEPMITAE